ncbi:MAG: hypothetical protein LCH30_03025 [Proteobacteria bacterium]|nr:hypothetical protein [Pseudomonadota bacterium]
MPKARKHLLFPSVEETKKDLSIAYSDHLPILVKIELGEGKKPLNIISYNTLGVSYSGIHGTDFDEKEEETKARYRRIAEGLAKSIKNHDVDILLLQESIDLMEPILRECLGEDWQVTFDQETGMYSCFKKTRLKLEKIAISVPKKQHSMTFKDVSNDLMIDVHNIHGEFNEYPTYLEKKCRTSLTESQSPLAIVLGDTNSRIAPLDDRKRNIITGIVPQGFNKEYGYSEDIQRTDYPDGGFIRLSDNSIHQLSTQILDLATGTVFEDTRSETDIINDFQNNDEDITSLQEFKMVMALDDSWKTKKVIGNDDIFSYETVLREQLSNNTILVRMAADSYNNKAIAIRFPRKDYDIYWQFLDFKIPECQSRYIVNQLSGQPSPCIFIPIKYANSIPRFINIAKEITNDSEQKDVFTNLQSIIKKIDAQILKLSEDRWYLKYMPEKINILTELKNRLIDANRTDTELTALPGDYLDIIKEWEEEVAPKPTGTDDNKILKNKDLIAKHRNILTYYFFSGDRPGTLTNSQILIKEIKEQLGRMSQPKNDPELIS